MCLGLNKQILSSLFLINKAGILMSLKIKKNDLKNSKNVFKMYLKQHKIKKITLHVHKYFILLHIFNNK